MAGEKLFINNKPVLIKPDRITECKSDIMTATCSTTSTHDPPKTYNKSEFLGYVLNKQTQNDVNPSIYSLYSDVRVAQASHNIYAYILLDDVTGTVTEHFEDNGEFGAGRRLREHLKLNNIHNQLVVVTRWYGGVNLGPARFTHILEAASAATGFHQLLSKKVISLI